MSDVPWGCEVGRAWRSAAGFASCGDAVFACHDGARGLFAVVDGLGHGDDAQKSAQRALEVLARRFGETLDKVFLDCDRALTGLRGAAMSVLRLDALGAQFAGVGNVEVYGPPDVSRPPCSPGVVGRGLKSVRVWPLNIVGRQRWLLVSDGIRQRSLKEAVEATAGLPPQACAEQVLVRAARDDDDASVLVMDLSRAPPMEERK